MFEKYVVSCIDGRIRVRHPGLRDAEQAEYVRGLLAAMPGVLAVAVNSRTGSLLLSYDPNVLSQETLTAMAAQWMPQVEEAKSGKAPAFRLPAPFSLDKLLCGGGRRRMSHVVNMGMLTSLGASMGLAMAGRMGGHVAAGGLFLLLNAAHLYLYRRRL